MKMQMRIVRRTRSVTAAVAFVGVSVAAVGAQEPVQVASPDGRNVVTVEARRDSLVYSVERDGRKVVLPSRLNR